MKILLMGFAKMKYMPYLRFYFDHIDQTRHEVHILYWNRDGREEDLSAYAGATFHEFRCEQRDDAAKASKITSFVKYRGFAKKVIKRERFDRIFALHTMPAVLAAGVLTRQYKNKFVFDYRDVTYEKFPPFKRLIAGLVRASFATFVSSDGFRAYLPQDCKQKILTSHNLLLDSLSHREEREQHGTPSAQIRIGFWGFVRNEELNREIIKKLANDPRFALHYYGREQRVAENLKAFVAEQAIKNVFFHGEYRPEQRYEFARVTDVIHNIYCDANMMLAVSNKYYDGLIFRIPQICMVGSVMGENAMRAGVGAVCDPYREDFAQELYRICTAFDPASLRAGCDAELSRVMEEYNRGTAVIESMLG